MSKIFPKIHSSVEQISEKFFIDEKRRVYLTPKSFLDCLEIYKKQLIDQGIKLTNRMKYL